LVVAFSGKCFSEMRHASLACAQLCFMAAQTPRLRSMYERAAFSGIA